MSSHPDIPLVVVPDPSRRQYDVNCLKILCPLLRDIPSNLHKEIVWPRNIRSGRLKDVLVSDVAGQKIGNVPANLCGLFKDLIDNRRVKSITCYSTGHKPRSSRIVESSQRFLKSAQGGRDRRGGGVVLDCKYILTVDSSNRSAVIEEIRDFLKDHDGQEVVH